MNLKQIFATLALLGTLEAQAMAPGIVISPLHQHGQFTVCALSGKTPSGLPAVAYNANDLFKTKGLPVIISGIASNVPWWALTTGTGYLLLSQCECNSPLFLSSIASGTAYAFGEQTTNLHYATQTATLMSCLMVAYLSNNSYAQEIFFAAAQAIILNVLMSASSKMGTTNKPGQNFESDQKSQPGDDTTFAKIVGYGALHGSLDCVNNLMHCSIMNMIRTCDTACLARILLYEQAYRLAQSGCNAAKQLFATPQKNAEPITIENPD